MLNSGPSRSLNTVVDITLPKILSPYKHRLLQVVDWQVCPELVTAVVLAVVEPIWAKKAGAIGEDEVGQSTSKNIV